MSRIVYVNGQYMPHDFGMVHIDDRGYQFGDGIYEVVTVMGGCLIDQDWHLDRMDYSLAELRIKQPMSRAALKIIIKTMIRLNKIRDGLIYFQVTRGVMRRDHAIDTSLVPQLVMTAKALPRLKNQKIDAVKVITTADQRWRRRDIKTLQLLPNCLAKTEAEAASAYEAWMVDSDGYVTEGSSSNAWIVTKDKELITRPANHDILSGITRKAVMAFAAERQLKVIERPFTVAEAKAAAEAFVTSASSLVTPVGSIDGDLIGDGDKKGGAIATALRAVFYEQVVKMSHPDG